MVEIVVHNDTDAQIRYEIAARVVTGPGYELAA
jgi:hypothetical protein